ncbi:hypothetical protein DID78_02050 [Candidatus Marinamargulisbacteria bacterium SCGC AG-343-D04]|nr:hypothetical protein DID78_02050 [Candidatus Marinamargulisbacteria bacterium SCGC AG-343-D04]
MSGLTSIKETIKKQIYIVYSEKFDNTSSKTFIERYVAKHPLLRPELIVVNDQLHGFKKISKKLATLEEFPIYLEIEGVVEDDSHFIDSIELYCESHINCQGRLKDIIYLTNMFEDYISLDRVISIENPEEESLIITSKIQDFLINIAESSLSKRDDEDDDERSELFIELDIFNELLERYLKYFIDFIKFCDDLIIKNKSISHIEKEVKALFTET